MFSSTDDDYTYRYGTKVSVMGNSTMMDIFYDRVII